MGIDELIARKLKKLPPERQAEVLDFVEFLTTKPVSQSDWSDMAFGKMSLEQALRDIENEPVSYSVGDCQVHWQ